MDRQYFFAQDLAGNLQRVHLLPLAPTADAVPPAHRRSYALDDGTPVRRIDSETFQISDTGALVTLLRD